jgi:cysteine-rich repeat protein
VQPLSGEPARAHNGVRTFTKEEAMTPTRWSGVGALAMILVGGSRASGDQPFISEVLGGCGDSPRAQYVEIGYPAAQNHWAGCLQLELYDGAGKLRRTVEFTSNPPAASSDNTALVATPEFAALPGVPRPDFITPAFNGGSGGEVCVRDTGRPGCAPVLSCVVYTALLPLDGTLSLRVGTPAVVFFGDASPEWGLFPPNPKNAVGVETDLHCADSALVEQGRHLFFEETFDGNGRTCGTCHPAADVFTIGPPAIAALPSSDPLFVAENVPGLEELERPPLLRGPRALILENVDGFSQPPVFRGTPHLLNVGSTAPYGLAGDVPDLRTFSAMAVRQHFPRTLARIPGVDFREPTDDELAALEAFMQSIVTAGSSGTYGDRLPGLTFHGQAARGRDLFFGRARCSSCHSGPFLSGPFEGLGFLDLVFDTGVTRRPINLVPPPECPDCPAIGPLEHERAFDVPALVGVRDTGPFFHDNSAATLREAVAHYGSASFRESPAAASIAPIELTPDDIDALTAFLESLSACGNGVVDNGEACDDGNVLDGDCCSAACDVPGADGLACDDGNACTSATECRSGRCVRLDAEVCGGRGCTDSDEITPAVVTCALASISPRTRECPGRLARVQRGLDRGMRLVEKALDGHGSPGARRTLRRAAAAFGHAGRLASNSPVSGCLDDVATAARDAQTRALCVRECVTGRRR